MRQRVDEPARHWAVDFLSHVCRPGPEVAAEPLNNLPIGKLLRGHSDGDQALVQTDLLGSVGSCALAEAGVEDCLGYEQPYGVAPLRLAPSTRRAARGREAYTSAGLLPDLVRV